MPPTASAASRPATQPTPSSLVAKPPLATNPKTAIVRGPLPPEIAVVVCVDDSSRMTERWPDVVRPGGYLDKCIEKLMLSVGGGGKLRIALLSYCSTPSPNPPQSPITHTQYFLSPTEFWASVRGGKPGSLTGKTKEGDPSGVGVRGDKSDRGALEGLVGGLELFDLHTSHPFCLPSPSPSPPHLKDRTSPATNPSPASYASPSFAGPPPNVERYLICLFGEDPWPARRLASTSRWGQKPNTVSRTRWNRSTKFDNIGWKEVEKELAKREVKMSLVGLGVGKSEKELVKMKSIVNKVSDRVDSAWFPTKASDIILLNGFDASPKKSAKRPLSSSTLGAGLTPPADQLNKKRKITPAQPLTLPVPSLTTTSIQPTLITANTSNPTLPNPSLPSNAASDQLVCQQQALARANANAQRANGLDPTEAATAGNVNDLQAQRLKMSQRMVEIQNQNQAVLSNGGNLVASQMRRGAVGGSAAGVAGAPQASDPVQLAQQQLLMQQRQQQMPLQQTQQRPSPPVRQASTTSTSTLAAPPQQQTLLSSPRQPSVPSQSPHLSQQPQSSQQRPLQPPSNQTPQPRQPPKIVWNGEISWTVGGGAKPGNNMVAPIVAALAGNNGHADLQLQDWPRSLHITATSPFDPSYAQQWFSKVPVVQFSFSPMVPPQQAAISEPPFKGLINSLHGKQKMGHIRFGPPGHGLVLFPFSRNGGQPQMMGMVFTKMPIPFSPNDRAAAPPNPNPSLHPNPVAYNPNDPSRRSILPTSSPNMLAAPRQPQSQSYTQQMPSQQSQQSYQNIQQQPQDQAAFVRQQHIYEQMRAAGLEPNRQQTQPQPPPSSHLTPQNQTQPQPPKPQQKQLTPQQLQQLQFLQAQAAVQAHQPTQHQTQQQAQKSAPVPPNLSLNLTNSNFNPAPPKSYGGNGGGGGGGIGLGLPMGAGGFTQEQIQMMLAQQARQQQQQQQQQQQGGGGGVGW